MTGERMACLAAIASSTAAFFVSGGTAGMVVTVTGAGATLWGCAYVG